MIEISNKNPRKFVTIFRYKMHFWQARQIPRMWNSGQNKKAVHVTGEKIVSGETSDRFNDRHGSCFGDVWRTLFGNDLLDNHMHRRKYHFQNKSTKSLQFGDEKNIEL